MMPAGRRQAVQAQPPGPALQGGSQFVRPMDPAPIHDHDDLFAGWTEGGHELVELLAAFLSITMRDELIKDFGRPRLHGAHQGEQPPVFEAVPRMILAPRLTFAGFGMVALAPRQGPEGETVAGRLMPPARPGPGKAPEACLIFIEQDDLAALRPIFQGREFHAPVSQGRGVGLQPSRRTALP